MAWALNQFGITSDWVTWSGSLSMAQSGLVVQGSSSHNTRLGNRLTNWAHKLVIKRPNSNSRHGSTTASTALAHAQLPEARRWLNRSKQGGSSTKVDTMYSNGQNSSKSQHRLTYTVNQ
ncbi:hypothetical protein V6N13_034202 [Hibiscus sabdariffa]|uniref:Uncharacterized protein n=1 Tax=Hibiscus sabdariffa TaxID=183260 RepID=A0ABR2F888_9ROSI